MSENSPETREVIVATGGQYYRRMRYFVTILLFAGGIWFANDGWFTYPAMNAKREKIVDELKLANANNDPRATVLLERLKDLPQHTETDLTVQKLIAVGLPLLGIALLTWALYNSRGEIRLTPDTLTAPGHPPVKLDQITALDKRLWDRKDIAFVDYEAGPTRGRIRLDAFVYQTEPIVKIYDRIEAIMKEESDESA